MSDSQCAFCNKNPALSVSSKHPVCLDCLNLSLQDYFSKTQRQKARPSSNSQGSVEVEDYVVGFGKNRGKKILEVEPDYIRWCLENFDGLRDVDIFNQALERLTGERVETPAAVKGAPSTSSGTPSGGFARNPGSAPASVPGQKTSDLKDINSAFDEASASEVEGDFPF